MDRWRRLQSFLLVAAAALLVAVFGPRMCQSPLLTAGTPAPAFSLPRLMDSGRVTVGDLRGKRAVLFFWAVWCPHCKKMLPGLSALAVERSDARFVAVHADAEVDPASIENWARRFPALTHVWEGERVLGSYRVHTFPTTYVLDGTGRVCGGFVGNTSSDAIGAMLDRCGPAPVVLP
jgi:thiol-disulfide isomerase/thioredoxin